MRDGVLDHDKSIFVEASYGYFQVARGQTTAGYLVLTWLDGCWISRGEAAVRSRSQTGRIDSQSAK
jgi:hypothetical protein